MAESSAREANLIMAVLARKIQANSLAYPSESEREEAGEKDAVAVLEEGGEA